MALKKKMTNRKGVSSEYHMIAGIKITDRIEVYLKSYIDESYRQLEKNVEDNRVLKAKLEQQALDEAVKEEPDKELLESLNQQIGSLDTVEKDYSVETTSYRIPFNKEDNISFESIYKKLKEEAVFESSEDC